MYLTAIHLVMMAFRSQVEEFVTQIMSAGLISLCAGARFCRCIDTSVSYLPKPLPVNTKHLPLL